MKKILKLILDIILIGIVILILIWSFKVILIDIILEAIRNLR